MKKLSILVLAMALLCSLAMPVSASVYIPLETVVNGDDAANEPPRPDVAYVPGATYTVDEHFYDTEAIFDKVDYAFHPETGERFLAFSLSEASKLQMLFMKHYTAFRLGTELRLLDEINDIGRLYEAFTWSEDYIINDALTAKTRQLIKAQCTDAYSAYELIKGRPEYSSDEELQRMIDYQLHCMETFAHNALAGLKDVMTVNEKWDYAREDSYSVPETIEIAQKFLEIHPELTALDDLYRVCVSGKTSKLLATLQALDETRVHDLYTGVYDATKDLWYEHQTLNQHKYLMPFPDGTTYQWPDVATSDAQ